MLRKTGIVSLSMMLVILLCGCNNETAESGNNSTVASVKTPSVISTTLSSEMISSIQPSSVTTSSVASVASTTSSKKQTVSKKTTPAGTSSTGLTQAEVDKLRAEAEAKQEEIYTLRRNYTKESNELKKSIEWSERLVSNYSNKTTTSYQAIKDKEEKTLQEYKDKLEKLTAEFQAKEAELQKQLDEMNAVLVKYPEKPASTTVVKPASTVTSVEVSSAVSFATPSSIAPTSIMSKADYDTQIAAKKQTLKTLNEEYTSKKTPLETQMSQDQITYDDLISKFNSYGSTLTMQEYSERQNLLSQMNLMREKIENTRKQLASLASTYEPQITALQKEISKLENERRQYYGYQ